MTVFHVLVRTILELCFLLAKEANCGYSFLKRVMQNCLGIIFRLKQGWQEKPFMIWAEHQQKPTGWMILNFGIGFMKLKKMIGLWLVELMIKDLEKMKDMYSLWEQWVLWASMLILYYLVMSFNIQERVKYV